MNFLALFVILSIMVPVMAIPPVRSRPVGHLLNRYHILKSRGRAPSIPKRTFSLFKLPSYQPTPEEVQRIANCFFYLHWKRSGKIPLEQFLERRFCSRLAKNEPNFREKQVKSGQFRAYRIVWSTMSNATTVSNYFPTRGSRLEDCFFDRQWKSRNETERTWHDNFCLDIATDKPDSDDVAWLNAFKVHRKVWLSLPAVANADYKMMNTCTLPHQWMVTDVCRNFFVRVYGPITPRHHRRAELYKCKFSELKDTDECIPIREELKEIYSDM